jgi:hypothetical protein
MGSMDYGGESINLTKFKVDLGKGMTKEASAFETITGKAAKEKGFNNVKFDSDINNSRLIFHFYDLRLSKQWGEGIFRNNKKNKK